MKGEKVIHQDMRVWSPKKVDGRRVTRGLCENHLYWSSSGCLNLQRMMYSGCYMRDSRSDFGPRTLDAVEKTYWLGRGGAVEYLSTWVPSLRHAATSVFYGRYASGSYIGLVSLAQIKGLTVLTTFIISCGHVSASRIDRETYDHCSRNIVREVMHDV